MAAIVAEVLEVPEASLSEATRPADVEGWDSLATMEILEVVEQELGIQLTLEEIAELETLGDWETTVAQKRV